METCQERAFQGEGMVNAKALAGSNSCKEPRVGQRHKVRGVMGSDTLGFKTIIRMFYSE